MSKNIIIQEGGTSYQFTAKKLKTDKVGGGFALWVPEEETVLTKKKITEEGTYRASDEGYYGYSEVVVDVTGSGSLKTKRITQNGTYKAEDDGLMGYSKVKVNVRGGNGSADSSGRPRTTFDSDGNVEDAPGGIGSAVFGTDPDTGEWVAVGVDSVGNLVTTPIPADIEIVANPTKTGYVNGETIDYSGIAVNLKTKSGGTFTNSTYPNGRIPLQELIFPIKEASIDGSGTSGGFPYSQTTGFTAGTETATYNAFSSFSFSRPVKALVGISGTNWNWVFCTGDGDFTLQKTEVYTSKDESEQNTYSYTFDSSHYAYSGNDLYVYSYSSDHVNDINSWCDIPQIQHGSFSLEEINAIVYGNNTQTIPVRWRSPYSGDTFEDSFEVSVTGSISSSGSTSGGGYSDDSGGSSSGGGGGF